MMMRSLVAAFGMSTMSACGVSGAYPWSVNAIINRENSIVVVWRKAEYGGGQFNGFDNNPVSVTEARYRAHEIDFSGNAARVTKIPVDFEYNSRSDRSPDPNFGLAGGQVVVGHCATEGDDRRTASALCGEYEGKPVRIHQLGGRAEDVSIRGNKIVLKDHSGKAECAFALEHLKVDLLGVTQGRDAIMLQVSYFPLSEVGFVALSSGAFSVIYDVRHCAPPKRYDLSNYAEALEGLRDIRLRDVALTVKNGNPRVLIDWTEAEAGVFKEHAGVLDLDSGKLQVILSEDSHPIGFWGSGGTSVLLNAEAIHVPPGDGPAGLRISVYDLDKASVRVSDVDIPSR